MRAIAHGVTFLTGRCVSLKTEKELCTCHRHQHGICVSRNIVMLLPEVLIVYSRAKKKTHLNSPLMSFRVNWDISIKNKNSPSAESLENEMLLLYIVSNVERYGHS
jgi:hypothetical protein